MLHVRLRELLALNNLVLNPEPFTDSCGKYHFVYVTVNIINSKFYIGKRSTWNLEDGYIGSGRYLWHSVNKNGYENFRRFQLKFFNSGKEAYEFEERLVTEELTKLDDCYNYKIGGAGFGMGNSLGIGNKGPLGRLHIYNVTTGEERFLHDEDELPDGWEFGQPSAGACANTVWTSNPDTGEHIRIYSTDVIPDGFVLGRSGIIGNNFASGQQIHSLETGKKSIVGYGDDIPEGWAKGSGISYVQGTRHIHNPANGQMKMISSSEPLPDGFVEGRGYNSGSGTKWIHNPVTKVRRRHPKTEPLPEGFVLGSGKYNKVKTCQGL